MLLRSAPARTGLSTRALSVSATALALVMVAPGAMAQTAPATTTAPAQPTAQQAPATPGTSSQTVTTTGTTNSAATTGTTTQGAGTTPPPVVDDGSVVTVTGTAPPVQHKIDRDAYDVKKDPQSQTGSTADVLSNIPSVSVDPQGNVSLRGNTNVQVYVNGKPSADMQGDNRAATLQSMSAGDVDSVEVITNPSAQFGADTGGGIINIVMKRNRRPGGSANIRANVGPDGRYNGGISGNYTKGPMTLTYGFNVRHDIREGTTDSVTDRFNAIAGQPSHTETHGTQLAPRDSAAANFGIDYNIGDNDTLSAQASYSRNPQKGSSVTQTTSTDINGTVIDDYTLTRVAGGAQDNKSLQGTWDHRGKKDGEDFKVQWRHSESDNARPRTEETDYLPPIATPNRFIRADNGNSTVIDDFSGDYILPMGSQAILSSGWDIAQTRSMYHNYRTLPTDPNTNDPAFSNDFGVNQVVSAGYITFQSQLGPKWQMLAGLRVEDLDQKLNQFTAGTTDHNNYVSWSPSLHLTYPITDKDKLRLSYSHKIRRPNANELNPFVVYRDPLDISTGNPNLKPQQIDTIEAKWINDTWTGGFYYNKSEKTIVQVTSSLPNNILLTSQTNAGSSSSLGGEYTLQSKLTKKLSYDVSLNVYYQELDSLDPHTGAAITTSGTSYNNRGSLRYAVTTKDQLMLQAMFNGPRLQAQGTSSSFNMLNLSYSHTFNPRLKLVATVNDVLNSLKFRNEVSNSELHTISNTVMDGQIIYVGLSYTLGGADKSREDGQGWRGQGGRGGQGNWGGPGGPGPGGASGGGGPGF